MSSLKEHVETLQTDFNKLKTRYDDSDRSLTILRVTLTVLAIINTFFLVGIGLFGFLGAKGILDVNRESQKIYDTSRNFENMTNQAQNEYNAFLETSEATTKLFNRKYDEMTSLQETISSQLKTILEQIDKERYSLKDSVNTELSILKNKIIKIDSTLINFPKIFYGMSLKYPLLNDRERLIFLLLSHEFHQITGTPQTESAGLLLYNTGVFLRNIGKYEMAIKNFKESLDIQPNLAESKINEIKDKIIVCEKLLEEREEVLSKKTRPPKGLSENINLNNKLWQSTLEVLADIGLIEQIHIDEISQKAVFERIE